MGLGPFEVVWQSMGWITSVRSQGHHLESKLKSSKWLWVCGHFQYDYPWKVAFRDMLGIWLNRGR